MTCRNRRKISRVRDCQCIYGDGILFIESIYRFVEREISHFIEGKKQKRIEFIDTIRIDIRAELSGRQERVCSKVIHRAHTVEYFFPSGSCYVEPNSVIKKSV